MACDGTAVGSRYGWHAAHAAANQKSENYIGVLNFKGHELKFQLAVLYLINGKLNFGRKFQYLIFKLQNLFHNLQNLTAFREQQIAELDLKIQITPVP